MKNKIKILYFTTTSKLSGTEKMIYELVKKINKEKYEVKVCVFKDDSGDQLLDKLRKKNIETFCLNLNKKWEIWKLIKLFKIIKKFKPDILQSFLFFDNITARVMGKILGISVIISGQRNVDIYRSKSRNFIEKITIPLADCIVSNSRAGKELLIRREKVPENKIKVIYNGIDLKDFHNIQRGKLSELINKEITNSLVVGFVGRLIKQKGLNYLLEAAAELKKEFRKIIFVLIGDGDKKEKLEELAKKLDIQDVIYFIGRKEEAWQYMKLFDVFVLPSLSEGLPNVIIEAIVCEVPVVATKTGGISELIEDGKNGFLVEPKNSRFLSKKIRHILNLSEKERKTITENARKKIKENFSIEKMVKEYQILYEELLKQK